jgi:hypothetical protein
MIDKKQLLEDAEWCESEARAWAGADKLVERHTRIASVLRRVAEGQQAWRVGDPGEYTPSIHMTENGALMAAVYGPARYREVTPVLIVENKP